MILMQALSLLLALSGALNVAFAAGLVAYRAGASAAKAVLVGGGAACSVIGLYLAGVAAYR